MNNMKKKSKKFLKIILIVIAFIITGTIIAYLTDSDTATNVFTVGSVKITLTEPNWNSSNGQNVVPGQPISKDPRINNTGNNPAYVYIKVVNPIVELANGTTGVLFNYTAKSGWTQLAQEEQCGYRATTYYYNTALNPSNSTTTIFDSVTINDYDADTDPNQVLDIYGYGIQSTNLQSGSTITSIFTDAFTTSLSDTIGLCPIALDCDNNSLITTMPVYLKGLARIMAKNAYLDNGKSEYVSSCSGVDFNSISSDTNGKGIYEIASTKNDTYPIYYYRGAVDNNVKFAGFCWKAIRTTDTGGVKLIYNGAPDNDGYCTTTTGTNTQTSTYSFNANYTSLTYIGYMYGTIHNNYALSSSSFEQSYVYGKDVTYSGDTYTLIDTMTSTGTWATDYNTLNNNHYTCRTTGTTCTSVYYIYYTTSEDINYITLTNGKKVEDVIEEMLTNTRNSAVKSSIDNWYNVRLSSYTNYIEDTIYCNDRSISRLGGWNPNGGNTREILYFSPHDRLWENHIPSLSCSRLLDRFTVSSTIGNGALTYPVGLITIDEVMYAGGVEQASNNTYYLYTNQLYWTMSPSVFNIRIPHEFYINSNGGINYTNVRNSYGYRPVISLKSTDVVASGDGTQTNPYVISTN